MSQIDTTSYADILSRGIAGGWSQFRQQHAQQQSVELENLRALARQQNEDRQYSLALDDRLERSQRDARERSSLMKLRRALIAQADGGGAAMAPGQEPASFTGTLGGQQQQAAPAAVRAQPTTDWTDSITDTDFADMTPGARAEVTNAMVNRNEAARKRKEQQSAVDELRRNGSLSQLKPETAQKLHDDGYLVGVPLNELPPQMHARVIMEQEQRRPGILDYLSTIPGGGDISLDQRALLESLPFEELEVRLEKRLEADEKAAQEEGAIRQDAADMQAIVPSLRNDPERAMAQARARRRGQVNQVDSNISGQQNDPNVAKRASNRVDSARRKLDRSTNLYESVNKNSAGDTDKYGVRPPTSDDRKKANKGDEFAITKLRAYEAMKRDEQGLAEAEREQETMLGGGGSDRPTGPGHVNATKPIHGDGFDEAGFQAASDSGAFDRDIAAMAEQGLSDVEIEQRLRQMHSQNRGQ